MRIVLDFQKAKQKLGIKSDKAFRQRIHRRQVPVHRFFGRLVFFEDELDQLLMALPGVTVEEAISRVEERAA